MNIITGSRKEKKLDNHNIKIEKAEIWITCESALQLCDGWAVDFRDNVLEIVTIR